MKKIVTVFSIMSISLTVLASKTVNCSSQSFAVSIQPSSVQGRHNVSTQIGKGSSVQKTTYQPQACSIDSANRQLNSASCRTLAEGVETAFVLEKNGATFNLNQKVKIEGMSVEMLAPMNFTIAVGLICTVVE